MKAARGLAFTALGVLPFAACERPEWQFSDNVSVAGTTSGGSAGASGASPCAIDRSQGTLPVFAGQTVMNTSPARRELYAYVTEAEAAQLRSSRALLPTTPFASAAVQQLQRALSTVSAERRPFVESLVQSFTRTRTTWPNPWALRLVTSPAAERLIPVRILLRKDAWIVRPEGPSLSVVDLNNQVVEDTGPLDPGRVAAVYVQASASSGVSCEAGYRELALGNEAMVERWELDTPAIASRLHGDGELLTRFFAIVRQCSEAQLNKGTGTFRSTTVCSTWMSSVAGTEYTTYAWSLSTPVEQYRPSLQNLTRLISALERDMPDAEPLVVEPELVGAGGAGGAGAAAGGEAGASIGGEGGAR